MTMMPLARSSEGPQQDRSALYDALHREGLQYGPAFRTLECIKREHGSDASAAASAVGRLRQRRQWQHTRVHPADLDGASHLVLTLGQGSGSETRLPFAVNEARLRGARTRVLTAVLCSH